MKSTDYSSNHHWIRRKVEVEGKSVFHRQCVACRRDFIMDADARCWRAVHVGLLGFDFLDDETTRRWLSQECPGRQLPDEINDRRIPPRHARSASSCLNMPTDSIRGQFFRTRRSQLFEAATKYL